MPPRPPRPSRRTWIALAVLGFVGFSVGAVANQGIARFAKLPEDAKKYKFNDVEEPEAVASAPKPGGEDDPLTEENEPGRDLPAAPALSRAPSLQTYIDSIVRRNIFDSSAVYDPSSGAAASGAGECKADSNVRLLATVVADDPVWSSALISIGGRDAKADGYTVGEDVSGQGRIVSIGPKRVCLDGGSCICMGDEAAKATGGITVDPPGADDGGITKLGENRWAIEAGVLQDAIGNFEMLATQLKVFPHKGADGTIDGYRVSSIRPSSMFYKLGFRNGDVVHAVNGQPLTSAEGALATYQSLKSAGSFSFDVSRKNQRQTMEYEVR